MKTRLSKTAKIESINPLTGKKVNYNSEIISHYN